MTPKLKTPDRYLQAAIKLFYQICPEYHTDTTFLKPKSLPHLPNLSFSWLKIVLRLSPRYTTALSSIPLPSHIQQFYLISPTQKCLLYLSPLNFCCFCLSSNLYHKPRSPSLHLNSLPFEPPRKPKKTGVYSLYLLQGSSQPRDWTGVFCIAGGFFNSWVTREAPRVW